MHNIFPLPLHRDPEGQGRACSPVSLRTALVYAPGRRPSPGTAQLAPGRATFPARLCAAPLGPA